MQGVLHELCTSRQTQNMSSVPKLLLWVFGYVKRNVMKSHDKNTTYGWPAWWVILGTFYGHHIATIQLHLPLNQDDDRLRERVGVKSPYLCGQRIKCPEKWATAYYERLL